LSLLLVTEVHYLLTAKKTIMNCTSYVQAQYGAPQKDILSAQWGG